jgi:hypothetical protein
LRYQKKHKTCPKSTRCWPSRRRADKDIAQRNSPQNTRALQAAEIWGMLKICWRYAENGDYGIPNTLWWTNILLRKITILNGKIHYK